MFSSLLCLLLAQDAFAVPLQMNHQGRLLDTDGNGLTGSHELIFRIMDDPEDGYALFTETHTVDFVNGYYSVLLGADEENNPLDDSIFANYPLHLALKVDGENLEPRQPMTSVPYAQIAGVAESVDGGVVNASEVNIGGQPVIDSSGNWVGNSQSVDFMSLQNRPQGLDDGDDNTQLSQTEVVDYVNGSQVNLGAASQVDGSDIVTADSFNGYLPTDLADGDNDLLASISCAVGEIISWDGNSSWICVSDATLELADIETMLANNPMDLNATTTIGGLDIVTSIDDSDTLASLSCQNDGEIARYDLVLDEWYCDADTDTDTVLDQAGVLAHVNGEALSLASGTQVNGSDVVTVDTFASNLPSDLADGDADTQLDQAGVLGFVDGQTINLGTGSQVNSSNIVTAGDFDTYLPSDLADGDADTLASLSCAQGELATWDGNASWICVSDNTLDESTVEGYITNGTINLAQGSQVDGNAILTSIDQLDWNKLDNIPGDLADGDNDTVGNLSCADGEYPAFDANTGSWVCVGNSGSGGVVVGTYVGDGNSSQTITTSQEFTQFTIKNSELGLSVEGDTSTTYETKDSVIPDAIYGTEADGAFLGASNATLTGTEFNHTTFNLMPGRMLSIDSGVNNGDVIIRTTGDVDIQGTISLTPKGTSESGESGDVIGVANYCYRGSDGSSAQSVSDIYSTSELSSSTGMTGSAGGSGGKCHNTYYNSVVPGGAGGAGGGGLTIISPTSITIGSFSVIEANGQSGTSGGQYCGGCTHVNNGGIDNGSGAEGSGGVIRLVAPQIIIDGEIITDSGTGVDDGALILFGNTDTSSAVGIPSSTYTFTSFSDYYYSKMYVDLVTPSTSAFEAKSVLNLSGKTYTYIIQ